MPREMDISLPLSNSFCSLGFCMVPKLPSWTVFLCSLNSITLWGQWLFLLYIPMTTHRMRMLLYEPQYGALPNWYVHLPSIMPLIHSLHSCQSSFWNFDLIASCLRLKSFNDSSLLPEQSPYSSAWPKTFQDQPYWCFLTLLLSFSNPLAHVELLIPYCTDPSAWLQSCSDQPQGSCSTLPSISTWHSTEITQKPPCISY